MAFSPDLFAGIVAFVITLMIFSYLIGDNPLYRVATFFFVGVSAGYVAAVAVWQVLWPRLFLPISTGTPDQQLMAIIPLLFSGLILMKVLPRLSKLGGPAMAYMVGVGAAVAIGGGVIGTLTPQVLATINVFGLPSGTTAGVFFEKMINGSVILTGVVTSLVYFQFGARSLPDGSVRRNRLVELLAWFGRIFIAIALGVIFAGVYAAALTAFIERINFLITFIGLK